MFLVGFGECLPYHENKVTLNHDVKDKWGQPVLSFDCEFKENEMAMRKHMAADAVEMLETSGLKNVTAFDNMGGPGVGVHEMGTARMGKDPKTSVLNAHNQLHAVCKCICNRWCLHDFFFMPKSFHYLYGINSKSS